MSAFRIGEGLKAVSPNLEKLRDRCWTSTFLAKQLSACFAKERFITAKDTKHTKGKINWFFFVIFVVNSEVP
jgi:hypothetical protein